MSNGDIQRAAFFVDGSNFFKHCERLHLYAYQLEWDRMLEDFAGDRQIVAAYYYDCPKTEDADLGQVKRQKQFFSILRKIEWLDLRLGRLAKRPKGEIVEKGVDVKIAVDMVIGAVNDEFDVAYLLSADADFVPAIEEIQKLGKKVFVVTPGKSTHLQQTADAFIPVGNIRLSPHLRKQKGP